VGTNHHAQIVALEEGVQVVGTEVHNVILLLWVSHVVVLETVLLLCLVRVTPEKVKNLLVILRMISTQFDFEWSLNLFDSLDILNGWADSSMAAEYSLLFISNDSCERHLLKGLINLSKDTIWVIDVLSKSLGALITEPEVLVHVLIFMVASEQHDLLWVLQLEGEEEADYLKTILALVYIVTQEQVVESVDVSRVQRSLPDVEESHQVHILAVDISDDLDWWSDLLDHNWLSGENLSAFIGQLDDMLPLAWELSAWLDVLALLGLQKRLQKHLAQGVIWVFINLRMVLLLRVQLFRLLREFINRDLSDDQTEILGC
jgi:hypothetical protein